MEPDPLRSFLRRLLLGLAAGMLLWLVLLRPVLDIGVARLAEVLIRAFEYPRVTRLVVDDHRVEVRRADFRSTSGIPSIPLTEIHFNTIVLLALYMALPGALRRRNLERLFMAWATLYVTQSLNLLFHVKTLYALGLGRWSEVHYSPFSRNFWAFLQYFTDLPGRFSFPFLLWLAYDWNRVASLVLRREPPTETKPTRRDRRGKKKR
jgi:hypothetical protein